jgi:MoxR-like ATPase
MSEPLLYTGEKLLTEKSAGQQGTKVYIPSPDLVRSVQLAQILGRPLLVKGEPGCGKSKLAEAIAAELFGPAFGDYYFEWNIKSISKAQDGLYTIDNLQRLRDANLSRRAGKNLDVRLPKVDGKYQARGKYIELGRLGRAFLLSQEPGLVAPPVVLIDEIDKADIDFPNDLLFELDRMEFDIPEIIEDGRPLRIAADQNMRPLFIITSNDEKQLPPAFLRRCLFHYIEFGDIRLNEIVRARFPRLAAVEGLIDKALEAFGSWRKKIEEKGTSSKLITTGELLDWLTLIDHSVRQGTQPALDPAKEPEFYQALLKDRESRKIFAQNATDFIKK